MSTKIVIMNETFPDLLMLSFVYVCVSISIGGMQSSMVKCYFSIFLFNLQCRARCSSVDPLSYFSFQPVLHDWCNKGVVCAILSGMVHIKEPLLLIVKSSLCGSSGFPFSLSEWSLTICLMPYSRK